MQYQQDDILTIDAVGLAALLHLSVATVRADVSRRPWTLPPFVKIGTKTIWLKSTVLEWLKEKEIAASKPRCSEPEQKGRGRGRPRISEIVDRDRHGGGK